MKFSINKGWCENMAKKEGDSEVGAGLPSANINEMPADWFCAPMEPTKIMIEAGITARGESILRDEDQNTRLVCGYKAMIEAAQEAPQ